MGWDRGLYNTHNQESKQYSGQPRQGQEHIDSQKCCYKTNQKILNKFECGG